METSSTRRDTVPGTDVHDHRFKIYKIQFCRFALAGRCRRGSSCTFAHSLEDLRVRPLMKKTKICAAWRKKACPFDDESCKFAHGAGDLQKGKPALCELFRAGKCHKGSQCRFAHHVDEISTDFAPHTADALQRALPKNIADPPLLKRLLFPRTPNARSPLSTEAGARVGREREETGLFLEERDRRREEELGTNGPCGGSPRVSPQGCLGTGLTGKAGKLSQVCSEDLRESKNPEMEKRDAVEYSGASPASLQSSQSYASFSFASPSSKRRGKAAARVAASAGSGTPDSASLFSPFSSPSLPLLEVSPPAPPYARLICGVGEERTEGARRLPGEQTPLLSSSDSFAAGPSSAGGFAAGSFNSGPLGAAEICDQRRGALLDIPAPPAPPPFAFARPEPMPAEKGLPSLLPEESYDTGGVGTATSPRKALPSGSVTSGMDPSSASPQSIASSPGFFPSVSKDGRLATAACPAWQGPRPEGVCTPGPEPPRVPLSPSVACGAQFASSTLFAQMGAASARSRGSGRPAAPLGSVDQDAADGPVLDGDASAAFSPSSAVASPALKKSNASPRKKSGEGLPRGRDPTRHEASSSRPSLAPLSDASSSLAAASSLSSASASSLSDASSTFSALLPASPPVSLPSHRGGPRGPGSPNSYARSPEGPVYVHPVHSSAASKAPGASPKGAGCAAASPTGPGRQSSSGAKKEKMERKPCHKTTRAAEGGPPPLSETKKGSRKSPSQARGRPEMAPSLRVASAFSPSCSAASPQFCGGSHAPT
ncbi:zinc finger (CCCH type) motif-containing protein, partial [Toxoplasma gondii ARI]